jgi:hypothetical protein
MGEFVGTLVAPSVLLPPYLLPTLVAAWRSHHQTAAIFALNLLLGWTVLGWIIALVWELTATKGPATP